MIKAEDSFLALRLDAMRQGFPELAKISPTECFTLQLSAYKEACHEGVRYLLDHVDEGIARIIMSRGMVTPRNAENTSMNAIRYILVCTDVPSFRQRPEPRGSDVYGMRYNSPL